MALRLLTLIVVLLAACKGRYHPPAGLSVEDKRLMERTMAERYPVGGPFDPNQVYFGSVLRNATIKRAKSSTEPEWRWDIESPQPASAEQMAAGLRQADVHAMWRDGGEVIRLPRFHEGRIMADGRLMAYDLNSHRITLGTGSQLEVLDHNPNCSDQHRSPAYMPMFLIAPDSTEPVTSCSSLLTAEVYWGLTLFAAGARDSILGRELGDYYSLQARYHVVTPAGRHPVTGLPLGRVVAARARNDGFLAALQKGEDPAPASLYFIEGSGRAILAGDYPDPKVDGAMVKVRNFLAPVLDGMGRLYIARARSDSSPGQETFEVIRLAVGDGSPDLLAVKNGPFQFSRESTFITGP